MRCESCGKETPSGKFCVNCGAPLGSEEKSKGKKLAEMSDKAVAGDRKFRWWIVSILAIFAGVCSLLIGNASGLLAVAGGILLTPVVSGRFEGKNKTILLVVAIILVLMAGSMAGSY